MRQAFNLLKQHKLFSGIYILGTALTIAMTMTMFIIFYVKFGPIYPEQHRDRMLVVGPLKRYPKGQPENYNIPMGHSVRFANEYLAKLSHVEAIATVNSDYGKQEVSISDERKTDAVVTATNEGFWRVFGFNFIAGHPYSRKDVASHAKVAVVCRSLAQEFWATTDAVGRTLTVRDSVQVKVVGVVDDCSLAATSCYSQIWIPMQESDTTIPKFWESNHLGGCKTYLLCDKKRNIPLIQQEAESMLARINKADKKDEYSLMGQPDTFAKSVLRTDYTKDVDVNGIIRGFLYILLTVLIIPSLNLSGMISSRMNSRLPELGIRKAYGASNRQLLFQVLNENFLLTAAGSVAGLVLSLIIVYTCSEWVLILFDGKFSVWTYSGVETMVTPDMLFNPWVLVATVSVCLVLNTASALIPAWIALRKTIIESILGNEK
ncbi:FtsX-like permease family protein [Prevotella sp. PINT]|jgi:ABC-type antimicrobial peptide transport system, permease component|uniref:ABC transporter permease n=1 Tax=Palleniella intestinalis TaxID=2736291 RepID=UPI0015557859|nr:ABC transporter permease [Palleniella intestinalis]NPD82051.1 FtsX-like permease family protein [Palleniella intestinalis]